MNEQLRAALAAAATAKTVTVDAAGIITPATDDTVGKIAPTPEGWDVAETSTEQPVAEIKVKGLDEKAVLVSVKRRMYAPYINDQEETRQYGAGNVNKHLFEGRNNRVKETISKYTAVYTFVKDNTVPWATGVDMLNIDHYPEFTQRLRELIADAESSVADLVAHWDYEVNKDLARLAQIAATKGKPNLANPSDYPTAAQIQDRFGIEVRFMPVPTSGDFRVAISDEDKASLQRQLQDAEANAAKHVIEQMLDPMQKAVEKLAVPIGDDGSIFRDSLIDNMVDVASRMARVNVSNDPVIAQRISDLQSLVGTYANNKDVLRNSQHVRDVASKQIGDLVSKMSGLV